MSFAFNAQGVVITGKPNAKGIAPSETIPYVPMPKGAERTKSVQKAISADAAASTVALSYFLEAAIASSAIVDFAGYAVMRDDAGNLTFTLKPESEELKKSRSAFNKATREALAPIVKADLTEANPKKPGQWIAEEWSAMLAQGSFAQCISVARKYVAFTGKLPCAYTETGTPDIARGLSVYAMQQVCKEYKPADVDKVEASIAARLGDLMSEFLEGEFTKDQMVIIQARLGVFAQEVKEKINSLIAQEAEKAMESYVEEQETEEA